MHNTPSLSNVTRLIFFAFIGIALAIVGGAAIYSSSIFSSRVNLPLTPTAVVAASVATATIPSPLTPSPTSAPVVASSSTPAPIPTPLPTSPPSQQPPATATQVVVVAPTLAPRNINLASLKPAPIWGPNYKANDGKPVYICGMDAYGSYYTLLQMQRSGKDIANGFHLGIVPLQLTGKKEYELSEEDSDKLLQTGVWDCTFTTLDATVLSNLGAITAIVNESAGADHLIVKGGIVRLNDLRGKRIAYVRDSSSEYFVYYALTVAGLNPKTDARLLPQDTMDDAVALFNRGQADAVSGWEPDILEALRSGKSLISSKQLRIIVDALLTSRQAIQSQPALVQAFHNAWFETLNIQFDNFSTAANQVAAWGYGDWTLIKPNTAEADWRKMLETIAQASLSDNEFVMRDPTAIYNRLSVAQRVWAAAGKKVADGRIEDMLKPDFVLQAARRSTAQTRGMPVNTTFSMNSKADLTGFDTQNADTLAELPCRRFMFEPESTRLTLESRRLIDSCVLPTLQQSVGLFLQVKGSAAWPGPRGQYTADQIQQFGKERAQAIVDYLGSKGVDRRRFIVEGLVPPPERRDSLNPTELDKDRFVEMTLLRLGR